MARVNANCVKMAWTVLAIAAPVLLMAVKRGWSSSGLGLAFLTFAALLFHADVFAERRAEVYNEALARFRQGS